MTRRTRGAWTAILAAVAAVSLGAATPAAPPATRTAPPATQVAPTLPAAPAAVQRYLSAGPNQVRIDGTSTLHDWTVKSADITGAAQFSGRGSGAAAPIKLEAIQLSIPVGKLKSTEGSGMDNTMYDALDLKHYPDITYKLTKATLKEDPAAGKTDYIFDTTGDLTIHGSTRPVDLKLTLKPDGGQGVSISTTTDLKMTDFGVAPPTAMFGLIQSGDKVTIHVVWQLKTAPPKEAR